MNISWYLKERCGSPCQRDLRVLLDEMEWIAERTANVGEWMADNKRYLDLLKDLPNIIETLQQWRAIMPGLAEQIQHLADKTIPEVTEDDKDKVMRVNASGEWSPEIWNEVIE